MSPDNHVYARQHKSMGKAKFRTLAPPTPVYQFRYNFKYITMSSQGVDVQNLVGIGSAATFLRMREKHGFVWIFLLTDLRYLSIRFFARATGHSFGAILTVDGSCGVFLQPLVPCYRSPFRG